MHKKRNETYLDLNSLHFSETFFLEKIYQLIKSEMSLNWNVPTNAIAL